MVKILLFCLLLTSSLRAQKLVINTVDPRTDKLVKETSRMKIRGTDRTKLTVTCKRIGDEVKLYFTQQVKHYDGPASYNDSYVLMLLDNNDTLKIQMFTMNEMGKIGADFVFAATLRNSKAPPTAEPFGLPTYALSKEQLTLLQEHDIKWISISFVDHKNDIGIREKDRGKLKAYAALLK